MAHKFDKWIERITHRIGLKLLALALAVVTWYYIRDLTSFEEVFTDIPLEVLAPDGWAIQERSVNNVEVAFRGSQSDIRTLNISQIRVQVDARNRVIEPTMIIPINLSGVSSPRSVRPIYVDPSEVVLSLDRESDKVVPVRVEQLGQPPDGYDVERISITPSNVTVYGPERRIAAVEHVRIVPIDMEGRIRSFALNRALINPGDNWQARMDVDRVRVEFTIVERAMRQDFTNVPVNILLPPRVASAVTFFPEVVNVSLKGRTDVVSNLNARSIHAYVDGRSITPGDKADIPVEVPVPPGANIIAIDPPTVRVIMQDMPE
ncbi:MAG TPA: CdaR family protein [Kiritimatiellia bacterium]|nr:CdaR family protein [Kiritimatiellia bacterium]